MIATAKAKRWGPAEVLRATDREAACDKRAIAISSNLRPAGFDELMPKTIATATLDRLLHHAHLCQTSGDSVPLQAERESKGQQPHACTGHGTVQLTIDFVLATKGRPQWRVAFSETRRAIPVRG